MDEKQRGVIVMNIEFVEKETRKERKRLLNKGVGGCLYLTNFLSITCIMLHFDVVDDGRWRVFAAAGQVDENTLPPIEEAIEKATVKHFAGKIIF